MRLLVVAFFVAGCASTDHSDGGVPDLGECPNYNSSSGAGAGGACTTPDEYCLYFEAYCHCNVQTATWYCCGDGAPLACPSKQPVGDDCCRAYQSMPCTYACAGGVATTCTCSDDRWHCTTMPCD